MLYKKINIYTLFSAIFSNGKFTKIVNNNPINIKLKINRAWVINFK